MSEGRYKTHSFMRARDAAVCAAALAAAVLLPLVAVGGDGSSGADGLDLAARDFVLARGTAAAEVAARPLAAAGDAGVAPLLRAVSNDRSRQKVSLFLAQRGAKIVPPLLALLPDGELGSRAAAVLVDLSGPSDGIHTPALLDCLRRLAAVRHACGVVLVRSLSPKAGAQARVLGAALSDTDGEVRAYAASGLAQLGPKAKPALEALAVALKDPLPPVRWAAAEALGAIGRSAKVAVPALRTLTGDPHPEVRRRAAAALEKLGG